MAATTRTVLDYTSVTEAPGTRITLEAQQMMRTRYAYAAEWSAGKDVLEVACGAGAGLGLLAKRARSVVGGDFTESLIRKAHHHYRGRIPLLRLDAHSLPFGAAAFDLVLLYEAIYFLARPEDFLRECRRVLRPRGTIVLFSANREWSSFNASPHSHRYYSARELNDLLLSLSFKPAVYGAFPEAAPSFRAKVASAVRYWAVRLHLLPKTMKGKEFLKRVFVGELVAVEQELMSIPSDPEPLYALTPSSDPSRFKVLCAVATVA